MENMNESPCMVGRTRAFERALSLRASPTHTHTDTDVQTQTEALTDKLPPLPFASVPADHSWLLLIKWPISQ